jgi:hypothetical protein
MKEIMDNEPPSKSVICALSNDGFYIDIFTGSHQDQYVQEKISTKEKNHFSDSEREFVPQTYAVLFHKWF